MTQNDQSKKSNKLKKIEKKSFIFFYFSKLPPKKCQGGCHQHCQCPQSVFEEDETEEATEKKKKSKKSKE